LAQELNLGLAKLESGVDDGEIFVALCDAGFLFIFRSHLRAIGVAAAGLQLQTCCVKLFLRELLLEYGNVSLRLKFGETVAKARLAIEGIHLRGLRVVEGARRCCRGLARFGAVALIEDREGYLDAKGAFIGLDCAIELLQRGERLSECGVTLILGDQVELRPEMITSLSGRLLPAGFRRGERRGHRGVGIAVDGCGFRCVEGD